MGIIGILGGTFDPPHNGHLLLAESARVQFSIDRLLLIPAGDPYRKAGRGVSSAEHRVAMVRLATEDNPHLEVDDREARRDGPTYTLDTLEELAAEGIHRPVFILGADALHDMPNWHHPERVIELVRIVIAAKGSSADEIAEAARAAGFPAPPTLVDLPELAVSSTLIRQCVRDGLPISHLVPAAVEQYIRDHGLYDPER